MPSPPRRYLGKIAFGEARAANAEISAAFGVTAYPKLLVVCGGNKDVVIPYEGEACGSGGGGRTCCLLIVPAHLLTCPACMLAGEMKSTKLARFLNQFYDGKKCAASVKIGEWGGYRGGCGGCGKWTARLCRGSVAFAVAMLSGRECS